LASRPFLSPRDVADMTGIEPIRLIRLGRCLGMASMDRRIPLPLVQGAMQKGTADERYRALVRALVGCTSQTNELES
jgi:hypothetical protein